MTLHRTDQITTEKLERMGFPAMPSIPVFHHLRGDGLKVMSRGSRGGTYQSSDVTFKSDYLTTCSTLGELSDLCRCLGIQLAEVPE